MPQESLSPFCSTDKKKGEVGDLLERSRPQGEEKGTPSEDQKRREY